jgi:hypothetical protein
MVQADKDLKIERERKMNCPLSEILLNMGCQKPSFAFLFPASTTISLAQAFVSE